MMKRMVWFTALAVALMVIIAVFFDNRPEFQNPPGGPTRDFTSITLAKFLIKRIVGSQEQVKVPAHHVIPESEANIALTRALKNPQKDILTWIGHATFLMRLDGVTVLTDPFMTKTAGVLGVGPQRFTPPGIAIKHLPPIDVIVISHNHYEHLDMPTLRALPDKDTCKWRKWSLKKPNA